MKLWEGRFKKQIDEKTNDFNSSISFDHKLYAEDIKGSMAHAAMLGAKKIISKNDADKIIAELSKIKEDLDSGNLQFDDKAEDIHSFIEGELTKRIGDAGKRLHTARSRNDQVALDLRMYIKKNFDEIDSLLKELISLLCKKAKLYSEVIMPSYTHLQRAQGVVFGHYLLAYAEMLIRDLSRLADCKKRMNISPLGCCALAGTTYDIDRIDTALALGFDEPCRNSIDGVSDRDFVIEALSSLSIIMVHLSRFSEEIILWCSSEFKFIELDDSFSTGSSIMPQKKNPDIAELVRGKSGRVFGDLVCMLTVMKGLPLAYNKDMQEDKEAVFDALDTVKMCLMTFTPMLDTMTVFKDNLRNAASNGFINATDCADYLVAKGLPFRDAYKITGQIVSACIDKDISLEQLSLDEYKNICHLFEKDIFDKISLELCVKRRKCFGAPAPKNVIEQANALLEMLK